MTAESATTASSQLTLSISLFSNLLNKRPQAREVAWPELAATLQEHAERSEKDGEGWSPVRYRPGTTRGNEGVEMISAVVFDFDHRAPHVGLIEDYEYVVATSWKHHTADPECDGRPDCEHWRVIIPLAVPCPVADWPETWLRAQHWLGPQSDPACKDPARFYWLTSCQPGAERLARHHAGRLVDWRELPPVPTESPTPPPGPQNGKATDRPGDRYNRAVDWGEILVPAGWRAVAQLGAVRRWRCASSSKRTGHCATTGGGGYDLFYVFCNAEGQPFEPNSSYTKFRAYSLLHHGGDDRAAARDLAQHGYGDPDPQFSGQRRESTDRDEAGRPREASSTGGKEKKPARPIPATVAALYLARLNSAEDGPHRMRYYRGEHYVWNGTRYARSSEQDLRARVANFVDHSASSSP